MVHKRKKRRTHVPTDPALVEKTPKSFVVRSGPVSADVAQLVTDLRRVMEPNTATHLKEREKNKIKDFVMIAGQLSVSHMIVLTESETCVNLKMGRLPRGPTVYFRVESFSLSKDVLALQKNPKSPGSDFKTPPLVILNNFNNDDKHLNLVSTVLQNLFPAIKLGTIKLADCRRVVLFDFDVETNQIEFRHYNINVKLTGVSKSIKNLISANLEDLDKFNDVSDYILKASMLSESDVEDAGESTVTLPDKYIGKGNSKSEERAIRLVELGPRMSLSINKIVSNLMSGDVLYHSYISKTRAQVKELEKKRRERGEIKAKRRAAQEANVKAKNAMKTKQDEKMDEEFSQSDNDYDADELESNSGSDNDAIEE